MISTTDSVAGTAVSLGDIEKRAAAYSSVRTALGALIDELREELDSVKKKRIRAIKDMAAKAAQSEAELHSLVEAAPHLFTKPKTLTLHGIKVGFRTGAGKIVFDDAETVIKLIRRLMKEQEDVLIRTKEEVNKDGLKTLDPRELSKIACRIEGEGEQVVLKSADDEVEKLVGKLIEDMVDVILEEERTD